VSSATARFSIQRDARALIWDARRAVDTSAGSSPEGSGSEYREDLILRAAVERYFTIVGEALSQRSRLSPEIAARLDDLRRIVAFRNVLVHGYAVVEDEIVWSVATTRLDPLLAGLDQLLEELDLGE
jgi:uncharacterized protein with HEPN domain